ncbi:phosphohydrolase [Pseudoxanthomonas sp. 10H]|uniref:phosphohydrolase n=1 Tax=Pseudoxanthomonas sp. 10H TaxID=3242729 RepID=UPI003555F456
MQATARNHPLLATGCDHGGPPTPSRAMSEPIVPDIAGPALVARARELARRAHAGQVDPAGRPRIEHVARVAAAVSDEAEAEAVAWLHGVLEACDADVHGNLAGFPVQVRYWVALLTRHPVQEDRDYYPPIPRSPLALRVKLAAIADQMDESRLALLDEPTAHRLRVKYAQALATLRGDDPDART